MFARLRALVRALTARRAFEAGLTEELRFHIEQYTEDLVRSGVSPDEARRRARMELGGINTVKEECREARGLGGVDALERECRSAARQLWRNPGFAGTVVLTLALEATLVRQGAGGLLDPALGLLRAVICHRRTSSTRLRSAAHPGAG